jgi:ribosomal protein L3 glutamine methyltransferase
MIGHYEERYARQDSYKMTTIRQLINTITKALNKAGLYFGHGTNNAADEAFALVFQTLHLPFDETIDRQFDKVLTPKQIASIQQIVQRRITEKKPLPYLVHEAYFAGLSFYVDERVIIPRSPIAELIEKQFSPWIEFKRVHQILDLCCGSGCIAIACAKAFPNAKIDAVDVSKEALAVAKINLERHRVTQQVSLIQSNLFDHVPKKPYDLIVCNPPYVSEAEFQSLPSEYNYEPKKALVAKQDGFALIKRIIDQVENYLSNHGCLIIEIGDHRDRLLSTFPHLRFIQLEFERGEGDVFLWVKK